MFTQDVPSQEQIGPYYASETYVSHSDTQEGLINKLYHFIRKRTLVSKRKLVQSATGKSTGSILDVGCGTAAFLHTMKEAGWNATGLEPDPNARAKAKELYGIDPLPSNELFSLAAGKYDAITMWHVLEHVHQLQEYVAQLRKLLAPGGRLFIAVPNYTSTDAKAYGSSWAAYDVPRHLYHFSPKSMKLLLGKHGMELNKELPMWFDSFYVSMLSEQYKNGKGNNISAFLKGLNTDIQTMTDTEKCSSLIYVASVK